MPTSINAILAEINIALTNATEVEAIANALKDYGYTPERIQEGRDLYQAVLNAQQQQQQNYGNQYRASSTLSEQRDNLIEAFNKHRKIARIAIADRGQAQTLALNAPRPRNLPTTFAQIKQFYSNALNTPAILEILAQYNITKQACQAALNNLNEVESTTAERERHKGTAQAATQTRDRLMQDLDKWMRDFKAIAKIALEDQPQLLESLGILVRS